MILFDPDLDPDPEPATKKGASPLAPLSIDRNDRLPSARVLSRFLNEAKAAARVPGLVTVLLTTDTVIRRLNRKFRDKNKSTDVLSFPTEGPAAKEVAGDLAISVPTARRQARAQGHALSVEIKVLLLHGLLHLKGYDHEADEGQMGRRERVLRRRLKLPEGLIERASEPSLAPQKRGKNGAPGGRSSERVAGRRAARGVRR